MKNLLKLSFYCSLIVMIGLTSCGGDDDDDDDDVNCNNISQDLQDEATVIGEALTTVLTDPDANCDDFKTVFDDYIDFINGLRSCLTDEQQSEIDVLITTLDDVPCPN